MATGSGKSPSFAELCARYPTARVLLLAHMKRLVAQGAKHFSRTHGVSNVGICCASLNRRDYRQQVICASKETAARMMDKFTPDIVIIDEAHVSIERYKKLLSRIEKEHRVLGVTATPYTPSGRPIYGPKQFFKRVTYSTDLIELIEQGYLAQRISKSAGDFNLKQLDERVRDQMKTRAQVLDALSRMPGRRKVVWACVTIEHAQMVLDELRAAGEIANITHSKMGDAQDEWNVQGFERNDRTRHLVSVTKVSIGYDYPAIDALVILRPTHSHVLYVQLVGRALRISPGKTDALILDYCGVISRLGPLNSRKAAVHSAREGAKGEKFKVCRECYGVVLMGARECPTCGYQFSEPPREITKNMRRSADNASILENPDPVKVMKMSAVPYTSRAGNRCLRIDYHLSLTKRVSEFMMFDKKYQIEKSQSLWKSLRGSEVPTDVDTATLLAPSLVKPDYIVIYKDHKGYDKVARRIYGET